MVRRDAPRGPLHDRNVVSSEVVPVHSDPRVVTRVDDVRLDVVRLASLTLDADRVGHRGAPRRRPRGRRPGRRRRRRGRLPAARGRGRVPAHLRAVRHRPPRPAVRRRGPAGRPRARAQRRPHGERGQDDLAPVPPPPRRHRDLPGRTGSVARWACSCGWRSTPSPTATRRGRPRSPTWTTPPTSWRSACSATCSRSTAAPSPDDGTLNDAVQLALVARHYERIGDHAVTIAEQVHFVVTGERTRGRRVRK